MGVRNFFMGSDYQNIESEPETRGKPASTDNYFPFRRCCAL